MLRVLDLFSGIGGFSLGLERTGGFQTVAFCEIEPYCRAVLAKHWPGVPCYPDVVALSAARLAADGIRVDVICGGWPCQDISVAGKGAGLAGARSGLYVEYIRLIRELRPEYVLMENVAALLSRGLGEVVGELAEIGYDAEWNCIPASYVGAPHRRDRIWIIAYSSGDVVRDQQQWMSGGRSRGICDEGKALSGNDGAEGIVADADLDLGFERREDNASEIEGGREPDRSRIESDSVADSNSRRRERERIAEHSDVEGSPRRVADGCGETGRRDGAHMADAQGERLERIGDGRDSQSETQDDAGSRSVGTSGPRDVSDPDVSRTAPSGDDRRMGRQRESAAHSGDDDACGRESESAICRMVNGLSEGLDGDPWEAEWEGVPRVAHGIDNRVHRLRALGNAVVPQVVELIGYAILEMAHG